LLAHVRLAHVRLAGVLIVSAVMATSAHGATEDEALERFLVRMGLVDLQAALLERQLESEPEQQQQQEEAMASRLADLYAERLVALSDEPAKYDTVMQRIHRLTSRFPTAKTPSLEVMLLQADYYRAEKHVNAWIADAQQTEPRLRAAEILARIAPQLDRHQGELTRRAAGLLTQVDDTEEDDTRQTLQSQWMRLQSVAGRALYFAATANYYWALVTPGAEEGFKRSRDLFRKVLAIEEEYAEVDPEFLGLESIWMSRALIGLALSEAALNNRVASDLCFAWLESGNAPPQIQAQIPFWQLRALVQGEHWDDAAKFAQVQIASFTGVATAARIGFCVGIAQAGLGAAASDPMAARLGMLGIAGLVKLRQSSVVRQLIQEYQISLDEDAGFYLTWMRGEILFETAKKTKASIDYEVAAKTLSAAIESPDAERDLAAAALCRNRLAWCRYRLGKRESAARLFEQAAVGLKAAGNPQAVESAWMSFVSYHTLSKAEPRFVSSAVDVLNQIKRDFPRAEYAKKADYYLSRLTEKGSTPDERLTRLQRVPSDSEHYLEAKYDICLLWKEIWSERIGPSRHEAAGSLTQAVDQFLDRAGNKQLDRQVKSCLIVVEVARRGEPSDVALATSYLERAAPLANRLPTDSVVAADYHYQALQLARMQDADVERVRHAEWLVTQARGSDYELPALIEVAKAADRAVQVADGAQRTAALQEAYDRYRRLAELLGRSAAVLAENTNARVACSKLAKYATAIGRHSEAAEVLQDLLTVDAKNRDYVRRAGAATFEAGQYEASLGHWRKVLSATTRGSNQWLEAKFYQLSALKRLDATRFKVAANQFQLLYPDAGSATWRPRFAELLGRGG
jgi:tetratricopeptide (TPR) repeat protein